MSVWIWDALWLESHSSCIPASHPVFQRLQIHDETHQDKADTDQMMEYSQ